MDPLASHRVHVLGVLSEECPVDALRRDPDRPDIREQIELLAHRHVRALYVRPPVALLGSVGRSLERYVALFDLGQHVVRDGLHLLCAVLDSQAVDDPELHSAGINLTPQQMLQDCLRFGTDRWTDPVAAEHPDDNGRHGGIVYPIGLILEALHPLQLLRHNLAEVFFGGLYDLIVSHDRLLS